MTHSTSQCDKEGDSLAIDKGIEGCDNPDNTKRREGNKEEWSTVLAAFSAALFLLPAGISLSFTAIMIPQLQAPDSDLNIDKGAYSTLASSLGLATLVGDVLAGLLIDHVGRLHTMRLAVVPYLLGWTSIAIAPNFSTLLFGRILTGLYTALCGVSIRAYISEIVSPRMRGTFITASMVIYSFGYFLVDLVGALAHWRTVAWVAVPLCLIPLLLMSLFTTESPLWLVAKGRTEDAHKSLIFLSRGKKQPGYPEKELENLVTMQKSRGMVPNIPYFTKLWSCLAKPTGYKPFLLMEVVLVFHEFSGTYIFYFYNVQIYKALGTVADPYLCTVVSGALTVTLGVVCSVTMKHVGRRALLIFSTTGMATALFIAGYLKMLFDAGTMKPNIGPVVCLLLYTVFNGCGMLNIPWMLPSELFPVEMKGLAEGLIYATSNLLLTIAIKAYPFMPELLGGIHRVLWLFAGVSLTAAIFFYVFLPETHNKTLAEIQDYFQHNTVYINRKKTRKPVVQKACLV